MAKGLTVIELIIVISILAILLSLAFPLFTIKKIDKASTMICSDLQLARMLAIKSKSKTRIKFNENGYEYYIHQDDDGDNTIDENEELIQRNIHHYFKGITFFANRNPTYNLTGTSNSGTITLTNGKITKKVIFSWTGRIRISQ